MDGPLHGARQRHRSLRRHWRGSGWTPAAARCRGDALREPAGLYELVMSSQLR